MTENGAIHSGYQPSDASLSLRARIAQTIAPLRRVTPRAPFWKLGAHRIPVLWSLYRGLLRASLTPDVRVLWPCRARGSLLTASQDQVESHAAFSQEPAPH